MKGYCSYRNFKISHGVADAIVRNMLEEIGAFKASRMAAEIEIMADSGAISPPGDVENYPYDPYMRLAESVIKRALRKRVLYFHTPLGLWGSPK